MERNKKKQTAGLSFSYIDIFFLLLAGLVLSFGIATLSEIHRDSRVESYYVYLSARVEEELSHAVPAAGDTVFGTDGEVIGKVLSAESSEEENGLYLTVKCRIQGEEPAQGGEMMLETPGSIRRMHVDLAEKAEQKGW